jgi:hypothetical protein
MDSNEAPPADTNEIKISPESPHVSDSTEPKSVETPEINNNNKNKNIPPENEVSAALRNAMADFTKVLPMYQRSIQTALAATRLLMEKFEKIREAGGNTPLANMAIHQMLPTDDVINPLQRFLLVQCNSALRTYFETYHQNNKTFWKNSLNRDNIRTINHILGTEMTINNMADYLTNQIRQHPSLMSNDIEKVAQMIHDYVLIRGEEEEEEVQ